MAIQLPLIKNMKNKNAWAPISGKTNYSSRSEKGHLFQLSCPITYLIELVAKIDRVDVVAFQVREHDDLQIEKERESQGDT